MSRNRSASACLIALAALMPLLGSCALTPSNPTFLQAAEPEQAISEQSDARIYGTISSSITHSTR